jgi:hypothetical protein
MSWFLELITVNSRGEGGNFNPHIMPQPVKRFAACTFNNCPEKFLLKKIVFSCACIITRQNAKHQAEKGVSTFFASKTG